MSEQVSQKLFLRKKEGTSNRYRLLPNFISVYYTLFVLYCVLSTLKFTTFVDLEWMHIDYLFLLIRIVCALILGSHILTERFTETRIMAWLVLGSCVVVSTLVSGSWNILLLLLFLLAGHNADIRMLAHCVLWSNSACVILAMTCSSRGLISTPVKMSSVNTIRNSFGFTHPNLLGMTVLTICCALAVIRFRKFSKIDILVYVFYGFAYYFCSTVVFSRTSSIAILLCVSFAVLTSVFKGSISDRIFLVVGLLVFVGLGVTSVWLMVSYDPLNPWMANLNEYMSGRIDLMHHYYVTYGANPFGYDFSTIQESYKNIYQTFICDNAFAHIILESGYLMSSIFFAAYVYVLIQGLRGGRLTPALFGLLVFAVVAFSESGAFEICYNFCLLSLAAPLCGYKMSTAREI